jgi:alanine dehydrogenase
LRTSIFIGCNKKTFIKIGVPVEVKNSESRLSIIPVGIFELTKRKRCVHVQTQAGLASSFEDKDYIEADVEILSSLEVVYEKAEMIAKVKEPIEKEYAFVREGQIIFTHFHFASSQALTQAMITSKAVCIAYETVEDEEGSLSLLTLLSEVLGRVAT